MRHWTEAGTPSPEKVVIVRALRGLGDMLCVVPALRALRAAFPEAQVTLLGLPWARSFAQRFDRYLDDFVEFPGYPGIPERELCPGALPAFLAEMQGRRFDLALQMHGSGTYSNPFTALLGARLTAGTCLPALHCPDPATFMPYPAHEPEVRRWLRLMAFLGLPLQGEALEFPLFEQDRLELAAVDEAAALEPGTYVCLHPGAHDPERRWAPEKFAAVGDALAERGLQVVLTGSRQEAEATSAVKTAMRTLPLDFAGRTGMGALAVLLANARLLVTNDTGISHLADALGTPSVVLFIASDPDRWAPLDPVRHRAVGRPAERRGCFHCAVCATGHRCLRDGCASLHPPIPEPPMPGGEVPPEVRDVMAQVEDLLDTATEIHRRHSRQGGAENPCDPYAS